MVGTLVIGVANALVEAAVNPLVATLYPQKKTQRLNAVHAWFPAGLAISGLTMYGVTYAGAGWKIKMLVCLTPTLAYALLFAGQHFPQTERVRLGVPTREMYLEPLRPAYWAWLFCMLLTASTELGPNQWIPDILTHTAGMQGILVLIWINGVMMMGRLAAPHVMRRMSAVTVLAVASVLSAARLIALSYASTPITAVMAATLFAAGICYFWPTMLGITSERFPSGGALLLAVTGAAGNLSVAITLPLMGRIYDARGPRTTFRWVSLLPVVFLLILGLIRLQDRVKKQDGAGRWQVGSVG